MKHLLKPVSCRCKQWTRHGDSKRVEKLTTGINELPPCLTCGRAVHEHGWIDGIGIVHPNDWLLDVAGQTIILRDKTKQEITEKSDDA
jgi:hypothetical protein